MLPGFAHSHAEHASLDPWDDLPLSYEALTNLEDVKLTAPPELLATMPLDMCLKGGQWDDKVWSHLIRATLPCCAGLVANHCLTCLQEKAVGAYVSKCHILLVP